jgi:hypothetical protein
MTTLSSRIVGGLTLLAILGAGVAVGITLDRRWLRPTSERRVEVKAPRLGEPGHDERKIAHFEKRLSLDAKQVEVVGAALRDMTSEIKALRKKIAPETKAVRDRAQARIEAVLSPEQRVRYAEMLKKHAAKRQARGY